MDDQTIIAPRDKVIAPARSTDHGDPVWLEYEREMRAGRTEDDSNIGSDIQPGDPHR